MTEPDPGGQIRVGQTAHPARVVQRGPVHAPLVDIVEPGAPDGDGVGTVVVPKYVLVDGRSMLTPKGTAVTIELEPGGSEVRITMSFIARGVRVGFAADLGIDLAVVEDPVPCDVAERAHELLDAVAALSMGRLGRDEGARLTGAHQALAGALDDPRHTEARHGG